MTCLDLAHYIVCVMSARAQSDKLPGFYMQIALFEFRLYNLIFEILTNLVPFTNNVCFFSMKFYVKLESILLQNCTLNNTF